MGRVIEAPRSKSMTQRALVMAALADGPVELFELLACDDSRALVGLLRALGCRVEVDAAFHRVAVEPAPLLGRGTTVDCGGAGTTLRFGMALSLVTSGPFTLDGDAHLRRRPVGPLAQALGGLGVETHSLGTPGRPPIRLERTGPPAPRARVDGRQSSQFLSALLLVAPCLPQGQCVEVEGALASAPYVEMTLALMERAGAVVARPGPGVYAVAPGAYSAQRLTEGPWAEVDWSGAAFLLAAGHLLGVDVAVPGLLPRERSLQGDARFPELLARLVQGGATLDLTDVPDLIAPLAALAPFAPGPTRLMGAAHTRVKECDRIAALAEGLRAIGTSVDELPDGLIVAPNPSPQVPAAPLCTHADHRMAMAFGLLRLRVPGLVIDDETCVSKSFPSYFDALAVLESSHGRP